VKDLYRQIIMDHYKYPKNKGVNPNKESIIVHLNNPSCGDEISVQINLKNDIITDIRHSGTGCSICCASASVMSSTLKNLDKKTSKETIRDFYGMIRGDQKISELLNYESLAFKGVTNFPARIKCATLAWKAIEKGINSHKGEKNG